MRMTLANVLAILLSVTVLVEKGRAQQQTAATPANSDRDQVRTEPTLNRRAPMCLTV